MQWHISFGAPQTRTWRSLIVLWEASDRMCGKRLKALLPTLVPALEHHGHLCLDPAARDPATAEVWAANTRSTYATQWRRFRTWCEERQLAPLDASPEEVAAYLARAGEPLEAVDGEALRSGDPGRLSRRRTAQRRDDGARRRRNAGRHRAAEEDRPGWAPRHATAMDHKTTVALIRAASRPHRRGRGRETAAAAAARGRRDAVIVALAFCAGLRRSEIAALEWGDITPVPYADELWIRVQASKANAPLDEEDSRRLVGEFARAVDELRKATAPKKTDRVGPPVRASD